MPSLYRLRYRFDVLMIENVSALSCLWETFGQCTLWADEEIPPFYRTWQWAES
jgi:hypothetical protein